MAKTRQKYSVSLDTPKEIPEGARKLGSIEDDSVAPLILPDGTLRVENIEEVASSNLSYDLDEKNDTFYFEKDLDKNTKCKYLPKNVDKVYETTVSYKGEIKEAYAVFKSDVKKIETKSLDRYTSSPKLLKKEIDKILKEKNEFIFTDERAIASYWNKIYIDSTMLGPYNYDVRLHVTEDIDFINDLIVVRSGSFGMKYNNRERTWQNTPNAWGVAWVSPHRVISYFNEGVYVLTGSSEEVTWSGATGLQNQADYMRKIYHVSNNVQTHALSSKDMRINKGQKLYSGTLYKDEKKPASVQALDDPKYQEFMYRYPEYTDNYAVSGWDGIIPSGVPFSIESWSTNPKYIGFDGEITIKPVSSTAPTCSYEATTKATFSNLDYQVSVRGAIKRAKQKFYKKLNKILTSKGIKKKSSKLKKYERLIERVAQNVYDGLSMVRNDQISKVQGLEANPLGGPIYYDGTIKGYGGSKDNAMYDYSKQATQRKDPGKTTGGTGSSSNNSSSSSSGGSY
jgi:hypothetical protein